MAPHDSLRDDLLASLGSAERVKAYLQWALNRVPRGELLLPANLRRFQALTGQTAPPRSGETALRHKGLYPKTYFCLFDRTSFTAVKVKSSFQQGETTRTGVDEGRELLLLLHGVQICPRCYFASSDKNHFVYDSPDPDKADLVPAERQVRLLAERFAEREAAARACGDTLFTEARTPRDALTANRLAAECAQALYEGDPRHDPSYLRAVGRYQLNASHLSRHLDDNAGATDLRRKALASFQEAYAALSGPATYETLFVLVKLAADLGDAEAVLRYGGEARRFFDGRDQIADVKERLSLDKHLKKINAIYEDFFQRRGEDRHIMNL